MQIEEDILSQKSKVEWLKLGDGNNSYLHASLKDKNMIKGTNKLEYM